MGWFLGGGRGLERVGQNSDPKPKTDKITKSFIFWGEGRADVDPTYIPDFKTDKTKKSRILVVSGGGGGGQHLLQETCGENLIQIRGGSSLWRLIYQD